MDRQLPRCLASFLLVLAACSGSEDDAELATDQDARAVQDEADASRCCDVLRDGGVTLDASAASDAGATAPDASADDSAAGALADNGLVSACASDPCATRATLPFAITAFRHPSDGAREDSTLRSAREVAPIKPQQRNSP